MGPLKNRQHNFPIQIWTTLMAMYGGKSNFQFRCYRCNQLGHKANDCNSVIKKASKQDKDEKAFRSFGNNHIKDTTAGIYVAPRRGIFFIF